MNLTNEKARHITFGTGVIKSNENGIIRIQFDKAFGEKAFIYPDAFERFLMFENPVLEESVQNQLKTRNEQIALEIEKDRIESERREEKWRAIIEQTKLGNKDKKESGRKKTKK